MKNSQPLEVFKAPLTGISLVEASAGTGKTYSITSLYIRAILENGLEPDQILVMTFTEAATAELKLRIRKRLKEALETIENGQADDDDPFLKNLVAQQYPDAAGKLKTAIRSFDEAAVYTIHGFCNRVLSEYSLLFDVPPEFEMLTDAAELLQDCVDNYWRSFMNSADDNELNWYTLDYLTDKGFGPDELRKIVEEVSTHPRSQIVPEHLDRKALQDTLDALKLSFKHLKECWDKEGEQISDMYLNGKLSGSAFRQGTKTWEEDWQRLQDLLSSERPKIHISERMSRFGSYMKEKGSKKAFQVPDMDFFAQIDHYMELTDRLQALKPAFIKEALQDIKASFNEQKRKANVLTYNDLLEVTEAGLLNDTNGLLAKKLSKKYPLALVDEFQDTDPVQYTIFKEIYYGQPKTGLFMIGDPKQAIYGFRGADIFTYLSAKSDADERQSYHLLHNYRSNAGMIEGVNSFFSRSEDPFLLANLPFKPAAFPESKPDKKYLTSKNGDRINPMQFIELDQEEYSNKSDLNSEIYETLSREIVNLLSGDFLLGDSEVEEKDIAVLVREGRQGEAIQAALREHGISSVLRSRSSVFKTEEAEELLRVLSAIQKISFEEGVRSALATSLLGYSAEQLQDLQGNEKEWSNLIGDFNEIKEVWERSGIEAAIDKLMKDFDVIERLSKQKTAERRISNLYHVTELLSKAGRERQLDAKALLKWFFMKVSDEEASASSEDEELRLESDEDLVQITTMHSSKGLEYPIVFCPFLWNSKAATDRDSILKFYHKDAIHIDISEDLEHGQKPEYREIAEHQNRAEDVRLTYVALTRAVSACFVVLPNYDKIEESPLTFALNGGRGDGDISTFHDIKEALELASNMEVRPSIDHIAKNLKADSKKEKILKAASFSRSDVFHFPRMLSYSSLTGDKEKTSDARDYDEKYFLEVVEPTEKKSQFGFPRGANAGTFLHKIFEDIEFTDPKNIEGIVQQNLEYYGIDNSWQKIVVQWVNEILSHQLMIPETSLSSLKEIDLLKEMEFFFPVNDLVSSELWNLIRTDNGISDGNDKVHGFMKGFIDLIFHHQGKFYILDYKSNHLGNSFLEYAPENLKSAMFDAGYDLQYHIYTLALHRYLRHRIPDYSYEKHIGGVLYLFLRGVDPDKAGSGIYFHKPELEVIAAMDEYMRGGKR